MNADSKGSEKGKVVRPARKLIGPILWMPLPALNGRTYVPDDSTQLKRTIPQEDQTESLEQETNANILKCVAELKNRIDQKKRTGICSTEWPGDIYLAPPILDSPIEGIKSEALMHWVYFYPSRPIVATLWSTPVPGSRGRLLSFRKLDPFQLRQAVFGVIPGDAVRSEIARAVVALFAANGHQSCPMIDALPTSVAHKENWLLDGDVPLFGAKLTRFLFYLSARRIWPRFMNVFCDHLRRYADPWERANAALEFAANGRREGADVEESPFSEWQFLEWFDLASAPDRVAAERANFGLAWASAIDCKSNRRMRVN